jgi:hypothetical protein
MPRRPYEPDPTGVATERSVPLGAERSCGGFLLTTQATTWYYATDEVPADVVLSAQESVKRYLESEGILIQEFVAEGRTVAAGGVRCGTDTSPAEVTLASSSSNGNPSHTGRQTNRFPMASRPTTEWL